MSDLDWKRVEPTTITKLNYRTIVSKTFQLPNGNSGVFDIIDNEGSQVAAVIALTSDNMVVIARQFRPGPEMVMDELPGGFLDPGEDPETALRREFAEETGYILGTLVPIGIARADAYTNTTRNYFLATDCRPSGQGNKPGEHEVIELRLITIEQLIDNAKTGKMTDPEAVLMAYDTLRALQTAA